MGDAVMTVRVGVVGAGIMGADHANTVHRKLSGAELVAVTDVDAARARVVAEVTGSAVLPDGRALIDDPAVDAVVIASHDSTHAELTLAAIKAGKPVLCEKPLAPTVSESAAVVAAERAAVGSGVPLVSVGFMRRFDPGYVRMKEALAAGRVGPAVVVHGISRGVSAGPGATSESSITGSAIHEFDCVPWLLDSPITQVSWQAGRQSGTVDSALRDPQVLLLRTADHVLTTVEVFLNARYGYDVRCEIVGERGTLALTEPTTMIVDSSLGHGYDYPADWRPRFAEAYRVQLQEWVDSIATGVASPLASARDGLIATVVAQAMITSMHDGGRWVTVESPSPG
ncbi:MAG TPA: Gfo/Idh/MocA family oxidoreductase [Nakamurella sp.]